MGLPRTVGRRSATVAGPTAGAAMAQAPSLAIDGWHPRARRVMSPNRDARPAGMAIELVVLHNISLPPGRFSGGGVEALFTNRLDPRAHPYYAGIAALKVSAHFFLRRDGSLLQFVSCNERAWHAGVSRWRGRERCNDFSIGIEIEGADAVPYTERQYVRLARLLGELRAAYPALRGVAGHDEIAPGRKTDPGPAFDWPRFLKSSGVPRAWRALG